MSTQNAALRRAEIVGVKLIHSAIFLVNVASILHIFWAGVCTVRSRGWWRVWAPRVAACQTFSYPAGLPTAFHRSSALS
jgi:hypothetical protein